MTDRNIASLKLCALAMASASCIIAGCVSRVSDDANQSEAAAQRVTEHEEHIPSNLGIHSVSRLKHIKIDGIADDWDTISAVWEIASSSNLLNETLIDRVQVACDQEFAYFFLSCDPKELQTTASIDDAHEIGPLFAIYFPRSADRSVTPAPPLGEQLVNVGLYCEQFDLQFSMRYGEHKPWIAYSLRYPEQIDFGYGKSYAWPQHELFEDVVVISNHNNVQEDDADIGFAVELDNGNSPWVHIGADGIEFALPLQWVQFGNQTSDALLLVHNRRNYMFDNALVASATVNLKFPDDIFADEILVNDEEK